MVDIVVQDEQVTTVLTDTDGAVTVIFSGGTDVISTDEPTTIIETNDIIEVVEFDPDVVVDTNDVTTVIETGEGGSGGGGGLDPYVRATPMSISVGGAVAGTTFASTVVDALDTILYPYQAPTFSAFSFPQTNPIEVGDTIAAGSKSFSWSFTDVANVTANTLQISDVTGATTIGSGLSLTSPQAFLIGAVTKSSATTHVWSVSATNTQATVFSRTFIVNWYWRVCYGESVLTSLTSADILALRVTGLSDTINGTKAFLGGGYKWICYPTTFGLKTTFKDTATNLDVAMNPAVQVAVVNTFGVVQVYYAHRTINILGGAINIAVS